MGPRGPDGPRLPLISHLRPLPYIYIYIYERTLLFNTNRLQLIMYTILRWILLSSEAGSMGFVGSWASWAHRAQGPRGPKGLEGPSGAIWGHLGPSGPIYIYIYICYNVTYIYIIDYI